MASADVAEGVTLAALSDPTNGITEIGGPEAVPLPDLIRIALTARGDARQVVSDPAATYWGIQIEQRTLVPGDGATLFETRFAGLDSRNGCKGIAARRARHSLLSRR